MVCFPVTIGGAEQFNTTQRLLPVGFFIINRAEVDFYLELVEPDELNPGERDHLRLCISKIDIDQNDIMTCIRRHDPQSPWWVVSPEIASDPAFQQYWTYGANDANPWGPVFPLNTPNQIYEDPNNFASKFNIADPIFVPRGRKDFIVRFDLNGDGLNYIGSGSISGYITPNLYCYGYMDVSSSSLFKSHAEIFGTDEESVGGFENMYKPVLGESRFRFSLMDGEGGPGGAQAGGNSAYDNHMNGMYGSVAAQIYLDRDESDIKLHYYHGGSGNCYQAYVGGIRYGEDNASGS